MIKFSQWIAVLCLACTTVLAQSYTVQPKDTLFSIAKTFGTSVDELQTRNNLTSSTIKVGQVLDVPAAPASVQGLVVVQGPNGSSMRHVAQAIPGDAVLVRLQGVPSRAKPTVRWNQESLLMVPDGTDWVGVGRELLGTKPKTISIEAKFAGQSVVSSLKLLPDPQKVQEVFMSQTVLSSLTNDNRERERKVLATAHAKALRTPKLWTQTFIYPRAAIFTSPFAQARLYAKGGNVSYHYGQDIAGKNGDPIYATNDGIVEIAGTYAIRGGLVGINHGAGVVSLYFHQSKIVVKVGQRVKRGQLIGKVGTTGFSTGPHLHWEMRVRAEATNPNQWVGKVWP